MSKQEKPANTENTVVHENTLFCDIAMRSHCASLSLAPLASLHRSLVSSSKEVHASSFIDDVDMVNVRCVVG